MPEQAAEAPRAARRASTDDSGGGVGARPLRADALRNRARVLEAARSAFAEDGLAVPLDEIARRAGVGAGTVYRHFATKEALFAAVLADRLEALVAAGRAALDELDRWAAPAEPAGSGADSDDPLVDVASDTARSRGEPSAVPKTSAHGASGRSSGARPTDAVPVSARLDPGTVFFDYLDLLVADAGEKMDLADALIGAGVDLRSISSSAAADMHAVLDELLARAQAAGAVRPDINTADLHAIAAAAVTAERRATPGGEPGRLTRIICDGLRPPAPQPPLH